MTERSSTVPARDTRILGIDIGGTGIKTAVVDVAAGRLVSEVSKVPTPQPSTPERVLQVLQEQAALYDWHGPIGVGFPGVVKHGVVRYAANMDPGWKDYPARDALREALGVPCEVINDADAAGLAEMHFGAGKPYRRHCGGTVVLLTLGTGIGSALFVDGHLVPSTELGHLELQGQDAEKLAAASVKTRLGLDWHAWSQRLNSYLQLLEFLLSPDAILIGGGISSEWQKFFPLLQVQAQLLPASMGNNAGIIGAALSYELNQTSAA